MGKFRFRTLSCQYFIGVIRNSAYIFTLGMEGSLLILVQIQYKMADWRPSWILEFSFPDAILISLHRIDLKLGIYVQAGKTKAPIDFGQNQIQDGRLVSNMAAI